MKIRVDFVSNSSSCSYVIACKQQYLDAVARDLSKACSCRGKDHIKGLAKKNQTKLDFCISTFQLAFLGDLLVDVKEQTYSLAAFREIFSRDDKDQSVVDSVAEREWNRYKKNIIEAQAAKDDEWSSWLAREYGSDVYDASTDTAKHYEKTYVRDVVVSNDVMVYNLHRYHYGNDNDADTTKDRVDTLVELAKDKLHDDNGKRISTIDRIDIYQITKDTVDNTRDMIAHGCTIELEKWENLDELDARLSNGDAIFYVRIAHSGDGFGEFYIYCEDGADGICGISGIEILTSESM